MIETWIGCSGFHYKEWKDVFYPMGLPQRKWFDFYTGHFNSLELNTTFYRFPRLNTLQNWFNISPEIYRFSVKAPRLVTHYKQFKDSERMLSDFYGTCSEGLANKLGCVLFQLPGRVQFSEEMLDRIIGNMNLSFSNVIEFRHVSWWQKKVFKKLAAHNIQFCGISFPGLDDKVIHNTSLVYYRFHGVPRLYKSCYKKDFVVNIGSQVLENKKIHQAYIYFNNTWGTGALRNARQLLTFCKNPRNKNSFSLQKTT